MSKPPVLAALLAIVLPTLVACDSAGTSMDDLVRLNQIQVIGTHNSYHVAPAIDPPIPAGMNYTQPPILDQLQTFGVRQLELDIWETDNGVFNCFHGMYFDEGSRCHDIRDCLTTAKAWSDAHPRHVPLVFILEVKAIFELDNFDDVQKIQESGFFDALHAMLLDVFGRDRILAPDDVRGDSPTLRQALVERGWPTLGEVRGKSMFVLNTTSERLNIMNAYIARYPGMKGALLFAKIDTNDDWGAVLELNNVTRDADAIVTGLAANYLVRTASDSIDWDPAKNAEMAPITPASGCHWINTDFLVKQPGSDYVFAWPSIHPVRCNPVTAPPGCDESQLE